MGQKKVNSHSPFFIGPNRRGGELRQQRGVFHLSEFSTHILPDPMLITQLNVREALRFNSTLTPDAFHYTP
ncbi:hypothetical protein J1N09_13885, partial [Aureitalea sp. L0-47]|uniref:hypothetical protein n=1 Tax=Aureitalea sp. L0-47 TaxID=2816962 RepID=UPI00223843BB